MREDITLSNGTVVKHERMANGAQHAYTSRAAGELTSAEWAEYKERIKQPMPVKRTETAL